MSVIGFIKARWTNVIGYRKRKDILRQAAPAAFLPSDWPRSLDDPTGFYLDCYRYFHQRLPADVREHRLYFHNTSRDRRGFGEDAFHVMWHLLFREFKPRNFLEIGIFRGQTISLAALLSRRQKGACETYGISPFSSAGDSVSRYPTDVNYYEDTLRNFDHFGLRHPMLLRAYSTDPDALRLIDSTVWDMIYIDGNHEYDVARRDWESCSRNLKPGGILVLDDSALTTSFCPPVFATAGHPGPSRVAREIDRSRFREVLQVGHNRAFQRIG